MLNNYSIIFERVEEEDGVYKLKPIDYVEGREKTIKGGKTVFEVSKEFIKNNSSVMDERFYDELINGDGIIMFMEDNLTSKYVYGSPTNTRIFDEILDYNAKLYGIEYESIIEEKISRELGNEKFKEDYLEALKEYDFYQTVSDVNGKIYTGIRRKEPLSFGINANELIEIVIHDELVLDLPVDYKEKEIFRPLPKTINIKKMYNGCKDYIIGQDDHIAPILCGINDNLGARKVNEKVNMLISGDTGVGKTAVLKYIAENSGIPIVIENATQFTIAGYVGRNVDEIFEDLLIKANNDLELAQRGIVVIDEIDKKASGSDDKVSGVGVLQSMLKFLEGGYYTYEVRSGFGSEIKSFNTLNTTFVFSGAFSGLEKCAKAPLGFGNNDIPQVRDTFSIDNLAAFGFPPEFTGRLNLIELFNKLSEEDLKKILLTAKEKALQILINKMKRYNTRVIYDEKFIDAVAKEAYKRKTNARGLASVIKDATKLAEFEIQSDAKSRKELILSPECIHDSKAYKLKRVYSKMNKIGNAIN